MAEQNIIKHAHAKSSWITIRMRVEEIKKVLVVETDLALNDFDPDYDHNAVKSLLEEVKDFLNANKSIDSADIERIRRPSD